MRALLLTALLAGGSAFGQNSALMRPAARIFVQQRAGFDLYVATALHRKHVPVAIVADPKKADYEVRATLGDDETVMTMADSKTGRVVYEWTRAGHPGKRLEKAAADACAEHINLAIVARRYPRKSKLAEVLGPDPAFSF